MNLKEFIILSKRKIIIFILLLGIFLGISYLLGFIFFPVNFLFLIPIISYIYSCYISENRKWVEGIVLFLFSVILVNSVLFFAVETYNDSFSHSCTIDADCTFDCRLGAVNKNHATLQYFINLGSVPCDYQQTFCKNNVCQAIDQDSIEYCEGLASDYSKSECYYKLAITLNNSSLCNKIPVGFGYTQAFCLRYFEQTTTSKNNLTGRDYYTNPIP